LGVQAPRFWIAHELSRRVGEAALGVPVARVRLIHLARNLSRVGGGGKQVSIMLA